MTQYYNLPEYAAKDLVTTVERALAEDIGSGDITAQLIPASQIAERNSHYARERYRLRSGLGRRSISPS